MTHQPVFTGNPAADMEVAKALIARHRDLDIPALVAVAQNPQRPHSSRIAAIYTLGFADDESRSAEALTRILADENEDEQVRAHAAEALGQLQAPAAIPVLQRFLISGPREVSDWCRYALEEMGVPPARVVIGMPSPI
jgi:HEAT repeat protein